MGIRNIINRSTVLYALYSIAAVLFFTWLLFPSDYFADYIEKSVQAHGRGVLLEIETVRPAFPAGIRLTGLTISTPDVESVPVDYISISVNLFSLIKRQPALSFSAGAFGGIVKGKVKIQDRDLKKSILDSLVVREIDLSICSDVFANHLPGVGLAGIVDGEGSYGAAGPGNGQISLTVRGLKVLPEKAFLTLKSLSFSDINAQIEIKNKRIQIENCEIDGSEFDGNIKGSVIVKYPYDKSVLRLSGKFRPEKEFAEKMPLELVFKKKVNAGEDVPFKLSGTIRKPRLR